MKQRKLSMPSYVRKVVIFFAVALSSILIWYNHESAIIVELGFPPQIAPIDSRGRINSDTNLNNSVNLSSIKLSNLVVDSLKELNSSLDLLNNSVNLNSIKLSNLVVDSLKKLNSSLDLCASQWSTDKLIGRCWGLTTSTDHPSIKGGVRDKVVLNAVDCQEICCELGSECLTWQYWDSTQICKIGKQVRLGKEGGNSHMWCEPLPPQKWNGSKKVRAEIANGNHTGEKGSPCQWTGTLPGQCFGLGPEKWSLSNERLSADECAAACCSSDNCIKWQQLPDRGCYFNEDKLKEDPYCDPFKGIYIGGRKKQKT